MTDPLYGPFSANANSVVTSAEPFSSAWGPPVIQGFTIPSDTLGKLNTWSPNTGVYSGSLSSQGHLVATQLAPPSYNFRYAANGNVAIPLTVTSIIPGYPEAGANYVFSDTTNIVPWYTGYFNTFMKDPTLITFGNNCAMPALMGVMPASFTDMQGSFLYYADLQLNRLSGSDNWDNFYFISVLNQVLGWITTANDYTAGLNNSEANSLSYYGADSYKSLVTNGFAKYQQGQALLKAFDKIGKLVQSVPSGKFGTANAVASVMLAQGLGSVKLNTGVTFRQALTNSAVNVDDIYNDRYTASIEQILYQITDFNELDTIQIVLDTSVVQMVSPMDYTSITALSKMANDSAFVSLADVGKDLYTRAPNFNLQLGKTFATAIRNIQTEVTANVEAISTVTSLLNPDIIANLRAYLPTTIGNKPASILNVIGMASGYLTDNIVKINNGLMELFATSYGSTLRDLLTKISQYDAKVPLSAAEATAAKNWVRVPPAQYVTVAVQQNSEGGTFTSYEQVLTSLGGPDYWDTQLEATKKQLFSLLDTIVTDPTTSEIARRINDNYTYVCQQLYYEHKNYNKANLSVYTNRDAGQYLSFVSSIPSLIEDPLNLGTDYLLYGLTQPGPSGDIAKAVFAQAKNDVILTSIGSNPTPKV